MKGTKPPGEMVAEIQYTYMHLFIEAIAKVDGEMVATVSSSLVI